MRCEFAVLISFRAFPVGIASGAARKPAYHHRGIRLEILTVMMPEAAPAADSGMLFVEVGTFVSYRGPPISGSFLWCLLIRPLPLSHAQYVSTDVWICLGLRLLRRCFAPACPFMFPWGGGGNNSFFVFVLQFVFFVCVCLLLLLLRCLHASRRTSLPSPFPPVSFPPRALLFRLWDSF